MPCSMTQEMHMGQDCWFAGLHVHIPCSGSTRNSMSLPSVYVNSYAGPHVTMLVISARCHNPSFMDDLHLMVLPYLP